MPENDKIYNDIRNSIGKIGNDVDGKAFIGMLTRMPDNDRNKIIASIGGETARNIQKLVDAHRRAIWL